MLILLVTLIYSSSMAQVRKDIIHFKQGGKAIGQIIEKHEGQSIRLKLQSDEILSINWDDIKEIGTITLDTAAQLKVAGDAHPDTIPSSQEIRQPTQTHGKDTLAFINGSLVTGNIREFTPWAVTLSDDKYYGLNMLAEIRVSDSLIVSQLKSCYPDIPVIKKDSMFIIRMADVKLMPVDRYRDNYVYRYFILLNGMFAHAENAEFQINMIPRWCHHIVGQVSVSPGTDIRTEGTYSQQASIGVGYLFPFNTEFVTANINIAYKSFYPDCISDVITYLSLYAHVNVGNDVLLSGGGRYYLSTVPTNNEYSRFGFTVGLGYNFQITPD
jgi:hypothetical protein